MAVVGAKEPTPSVSKKLVTNPTTRRHASGNAPPRAFANHCQEKPSAMSNSTPSSSFEVMLTGGKPVSGPGLFVVYERAEGCLPGARLFHQHRRDDQRLLRRLERF